MLPRAVVPELNLANLEAGLKYPVVFKRQRSRFQGVQQVLFTVNALSAIREFVTKEVEPESWIRALEMGIAADQGQRGIKFLRGKKADGNGTLIELKLLLSPAESA